MRIFGTILTTKDINSNSFNTLDKLKLHESLKKSKRDALIRYAFNFQDINIEKNFFGKPKLLNSNIHFNITHSNNIILIAIDESPIGIDSEFVKPININYDFLSNYDKSYINSSKKTDIAFFKLWVLKESFTKNIGLGMSLSFDSFYIDPNKMYIDFNNVRFFFKFYTKNNYLISVCSNKNKFPENIIWLSI